MHAAGARVLEEWQFKPVVRFRKKVGVRPKEESWVPLAFSGLLIVGLCLLLYIYQCALIVNMQYHISSLRKANKVLVRERASLQLEVENLSSFNRIERIATRKWGMDKPLGRMVVDYSKSVANTTTLIP
jgi:cell division protein FtsL